jgi:hypothetical protein
MASLDEILELGRTAARRRIARAAVERGEGSAPGYQEASAQPNGLAHGMLATATADPAERAALRMRESVQPSRGRAYSPGLETALRTGLEFAPYGIGPVMGGINAVTGGSPADVGLSTVASGALPKWARVLGGIGGMAMEPEEAEAGGATKAAKAAVLGAKELFKQFGLRKGQVTVRDPVRIEAPGIYKDPRVITREATEQLAPESPALKQLFGVTRQDLADIAASRSGNVAPQDIPGMTWPTGRGGGPPVTPEAVQQIMNPRNAQRYIDVLAESSKVPGLAQTRAWYVMDPAYRRLEELVGPEEAVRMYTRSNRMTGPFSASSPVDWELQRGSRAAMMANQGRWPEFLQYGGVAEEQRPKYLTELFPMPGHMAHSTAHTPALTRWLGGEPFEMGTGKVPGYISASGVPQTGFQTGYPVIDAHMGTSTGYYDVRPTAGVSMGKRETHPIGQWFGQEVAKPMGIEPVSAQAQGWSVFGPQTGVASTIGAPKLEIAADEIMRRARREGLDPEAVRDSWLMSRSAIGAIGGLGGGGLAGPLLGLAGQGDNEPTPRARGGDVEPGHSYLVGEEGPEVVVPRQPGTVLAMEDTRDPFNPLGGRMRPGEGGTSRGKNITAEEAAYRVGVADALNKKGVLGTGEAVGATILDKGTPEVQAAYRRGIEEGLRKR